jgi:hypothetical protein
VLEAVSDTLRVSACSDLAYLRKVILMTAAITCLFCTVNCSGHGLDDLLYTSGITAQRYTVDNAIQREAQHVILVQASHPHFALTDVHFMQSHTAVLLHYY